MSLLIPSGYHKRIAIDYIRRCIELFIHPGAGDQQKLAIENYFVWMLNNNRAIDVQAKVDIDGSKLGFALIITNPLGEKDKA